jgi:hypothetical protein
LEFNVFTLNGFQQAVEKATAELQVQPFNLSNRIHAFERCTHYKFTLHQMLLCDYTRSLDGHIQQVEQQQDITLLLLCMAPAASAGVPDTAFALSQLG